MRKLLALLTLLLGACQTVPTSTAPAVTPGRAGRLAVAPDVEQRTRRMPKTVIDYDRSLLNQNERQVVEKLIEASKFARARRLLSTCCVTNQEIEPTIAGLTDIPVDVTPVFPAAGEKE